MRGVICCAVAALAVLAATAGSASADRGGVKHVTVIHPEAAPAAGFDARSIGFALRDAGGFHVSDTATAQRVRELVTLQTSSTPRSLVYDLQPPAGVAAFQLGPRAVAFVQDGVQVATFVAPAMVDASGAISRAIEVELHGNAITVTPSAAWLASATYPVTVDPDVLTLQGANQDTYIESGSPDGYFAGDPQLLVGNDGTQTVRGLLNFQVDMYVPAGATIDSAQLSLHLESATTTTPTTVTVANVTAPWSWVTWQRYDYDWQTGASLFWTTPGGDVDPSVVASAAVAPTPGTTSFDVTQLIQREVSGLVQSDGFLLEQQTEATNQLLGFTSSYSWSGNPLPTLTVTWESASTSGPAVSIPTGNSVTFGTAWVGSTTPTQEVDVQNSGNAPLDVSSLAIAGANASDFKVTGETCSGAPVQPGATCAVTLSATPSAAGNRTGTLVITDDAPNSPQNVALSVNGQVPVSATYSPPDGLLFPQTKVGKTSGTQYVTVKSTGQSALAISSVSLGGQNPADFVIASNTCAGATLAPGASCQIGIRARPTVRNAYREATVVIRDNDANGGASLPLTVWGY